MSIKFNRTPRLHSLLLFLQFKQSGVPSSHLRCLSLHVKQPVRTRLLLAGVLVCMAVFFMSDAVDDDAVAARRLPLGLGGLMGSDTATTIALDSFRRFKGLTLARSYAAPILRA